MKDDNDFAKDSATLAGDITRQFISIAFGGIGFAIGILHTSSAVILGYAAWLVLALFGLSAVFGLLFLMHLTWQVAVEKSYDIYAGGLRILSALQVSIAIAGIILLCIFFAQPDRHDDNSSRVTLDCSNGKIYQITVKNGQVIVIDAVPDGLPDIGAETAVPVE
jgi:hypothetical protein